MLFAIIPYAFPIISRTLLIFMQRFMVKIRDKRKEKHTDLTWFDRLPMSMGIGKKAFTISEIRVT